jgi:CBS domain-containing protein
MRRRFIALAPGDPLLEAERLMRMARVRFLPVSDDGVLVGGLSHRALLGSILAGEGRNPLPLARWLSETPVAVVMEPEPARATPDMRLDEAAMLLVEVDGGCLPVVEPEAGAALLVGVVTESDLLRAAFDPRPR